MCDIMSHYIVSYKPIQTHNSSNNGYSINSSNNGYYINSSNDGYSINSSNNSY